MEKNQIREIILNILEPRLQEHVNKINKCLGNKNSNELETNNAEMWIKQIEATMNFIDGIPIDIKKVILKKIKEKKI